LINKQAIWICVAVLLFPTALGAVELFSLEKSVEYGLEHSPIIQGMGIRIDQSDMDIKAQRGRFLPSISAGYTYTQISNISSEGNTDDDYLDQKNDSANLRLTQVLFSGFEYKNRFERAKLDKEYQQARLEVQKLDLIYRIKSAFFELLKTRHDLVSTTQRIKRLTSDLDQARAFFDSRVSPYVDVLRAESDLEDSKQTLWKTETAITEYEAMLKRLMGLSQGRVTDLEVEFKGEFEDFDVFDRMDMDLDSCLDKALLNRPEISLFSLQSGMAEKDVSIVNAKYYPQVSFDVGVYDLDKRYTNEPRYDRENRYWSAGVSAKWSLFDGGSTMYEKQRYLLEIQRIDTERKQVELEIKEEVSVTFTSLMEAKKRLVSVEKELAASQENYARQKTRFKARIGTISELFDAQAVLTRSESSKSQALLDCQLLLARLQKALGMVMTPSGETCQR